jgi:DNA-directed RNA polymerase subunit K/omega
MFTREIDFKLEETENVYATCRALSLRARHINAKKQESEPGADTAVVTLNNPTVGALGDYSRGRIVVSREEQEPA